MPWTGTEYLEPFPAGPAGVAVSGDYLVAISDTATGTYGAGHYSILHIPTMTCRLFDGLGTGSRTAAAVAAGLVWTMKASSSNVMHAINPVTGAPITRSWTTSATTGKLVGLGSSYVAGGGRIHNIGANTSAAVAAVGTMVGALGTRLFSANGVNYLEIDPATGSTIASWAHGATVQASQEAAVIGNRLHWKVTVSGATNIGWLDPVAGTTGIVMLSPPGAPTTFGSDLCAHSDGNLYALTGGSSSAELIAIDPVTGAWTNDTLPTTRTNRYSLASSAGKLWIPSGDPTT